MKTRGAWLSLWCLLLAGLLLPSCTLPVLGMESTVFTAANVLASKMPTLGSHIYETGVRILSGGLEGRDGHFALARDSTPPVVNIKHEPKEPTNQDAVTFTATATDNTGLDTIQIWVDNQLTKSCRNSPCIFNGGFFSVGTHAYYAIAWDKFQNKAMTQVQYFRVRGIIPKPMRNLVIDNPYKGYPYWWKGQIHCHSEESYGILSDLGYGSAQSPRELTQWYRCKGYNFICITDHNHVTEINPPEPGILEIVSAEDGAWYRHHILALNISGDTWSHWGGPATCWCSNVEERILYYHNKRGLDNSTSVIVLAHPSASHSHSWWKHIWGACGEGWSWEDLSERSGPSDGIEVYNATEPGGWELNERWWGDLAKIQPSWAGNRGVLGFGGDDCHDATNNPNFNKCWIVVNSTFDPSTLAEQDYVWRYEMARDILSNIQAGNFYIIVRGILGGPSGDGTDYIMPKVDFQIDYSLAGSLPRISVTTDRESTICFFNQDGLLKKEEGVSAASQGIGEDWKAIRFTIDQWGDDGYSYRICSQWFFIKPVER